MKILFITGPLTDYLADPILIGLREIFGENCVDYPKREILYENCNQKTKNGIRGNGFTLYDGPLEDIDIDRFDIYTKLRQDFFDLSDPALGHPLM